MNHLYTHHTSYISSGKHFIFLDNIYAGKAGKNQRRFMEELLLRCVPRGDIKSSRYKSLYRYISCHNYMVSSYKHDRCYIGCLLPDDVVICCDNDQVFHLMSLEDAVMISIKRGAETLAHLLKYNAVIMDYVNNSKLLINMRSYDPELEFKEDYNLWIELGDRVIERFDVMPLREVSGILRDNKAVVITPYRYIDKLNLSHTVFVAPASRSELEDASGFIYWDMKLTDDTTIRLVNGRTEFVSSHIADMIDIYYWLLDSCTPLENIPDDIVVGNILGVRVWYIPESWRSKHLLGQTGYRWAKPQVKAKCRDLLKPYRHDAPHSQCTCGIYLILKDKIPIFDIDNIDGVVLGIAAAYGRAFIGTNGLRAENARAILVVVPSKDYLRFVWPGVKGITVEEALDYMRQGISAGEVISGCRLDQSPPR